MTHGKLSLCKCSSVLYKKIYRCKFVLTNMITNGRRSTHIAISVNPNSKQLKVISKYLYPVSELSDKIRSKTYFRILCGSENYRGDYQLL